MDRTTLWAKYSRNRGSWTSLERHLRDTAGIAGALWRTWLPDATKRPIIDSLQCDDDTAVDATALAEKLAVFHAAAHDAGKASAVFQAMVPELARVSGWPTTVRDGTAPAMRHASVGAVSLRRWLRDKGFGGYIESTHTAVIAGHHGIFTGNDGLVHCEDLLAMEPRVFAEARNAFFDDAAGLAGLTDADWAVLSHRSLSPSAQMALTGFLIVSDWVASNENLLPHTEDVDVDCDHTERVRRALERFDAPAPWQPAPPDNIDDIFAARFAAFAGDAGATPRPMQQAAANVAAALTEPSLILIEAPTGEGKTEAALAAAEIIAAAHGAGGVMMALPTQATSDAMFDRVLDWLSRAVSDSNHTSTALCHGKAVFNDAYRDLLGRTRDNNDTDRASFNGASDSDHVHQWFTSGRTSALAGFTVGTIDQFLLTALKTRFLMLRHLGTMGKVIILDEVHSADEYMSVYLDRALEWAGTHGIPVIALSATLAADRRVELLRAYRRGRLFGIGDDDAASADDAHLFDDIRTTTAFPLIATVSSGDPALHAPAASTRTRATTVEFIGDDEQGTVDRILEELDHADHTGTIAVVCNTVSRARGIHALLRKALPDWTDDEVHLLHSRFTVADRKARETEITAALGPDPTARPKRLIIVGTQVLEQSLDIDVDLMVSDVAPMDLIIQRIGRLHRHRAHDAGRPAAFAAPRLLLTGAVIDDEGAAPIFPRGSEAVYNRALLLRTLAALRTHGDGLDGVLTVVSPDDVAPLIQATYTDDPDIPESWRTTWHEAETRRTKTAHNRAAEATRHLLEPPPSAAYDAHLLGLNDIASAEERNGTSAVRDGGPNLEAILAVADEPEGSLSPLRPAPDGDTHLALARGSIDIPAWAIAPDMSLEQLADHLETLRPADWEHSPWLSAALPMPLDDHGRFRIGDLVFHYDRQQGLTIDHET